MHASVTTTSGILIVSALDYPALIKTLLIIYGFMTRIWKKLSMNKHPKFNPLKRNNIENMIAEKLLENIIRCLSFYFNW